MEPAGDYPRFSHRLDDDLYAAARRMLTIGSEIIEAAMSFRCRFWEYLAFRPLLSRYFNEDPEFLWSQAPRPRLSDKSYKHNYYDERISLEERLVRTANKDFVTTEEEILFDAADVMRVGKDLFIQHGLTTTHLTPGRMKPLSF